MQGITRFFLKSFAFILFLLFCTKTFAQNCKAYKIKGYCELMCKTDKKSLRIFLNISVLDASGKERDIQLVPVKTDGTLAFEDNSISRLSDDHKIKIAGSITGTIKDNKFYCICPSINAERFNCNTGLYDGIANRLKIRIIDSASCNPGFLRSYAKQLLPTDPEIAAGLYDFIDMKNFDRTYEEKFHTQMSLAAAYYQTKNFEDEKKVFFQLPDEVPIDSLSRGLQENYWAGNYGNINNLFGMDSIKKRSSKINFNKDFGEIVMTDSNKLEVWKIFIAGFVNSEYAKRQKVSIDQSFNSPDDILNQKKHIAEALGIKETYK